MYKKILWLFLILFTILNSLIPVFAYGSDFQEQWAEEAVQAWLKKSHIERAETVDIINRTLLQILIAKSTDDMIVEESGSIVENKIINNLYITKEVGNGSVTLKNVIIKGELLVEGGGQNSIILENTSVNQLTANKINGKVRILLEGDTSIESTSIKSDVILEQEKLSGSGFKKLTINVNSSVQILSDKKIKLTSSDKNVVEVGTGGLVTAKEHGISVISTIIGGKKTEICEIKVVDPLAKSIKILSIGNSFSQDTVFYLYDIAKSAGINLVVGNAYNSGCSLERHWNYAKNNDKAYTYYKWTSYDMTTQEDQTMKNIILDEQWDYITIQQSSGESGIYSTFQPYLNKLITYVKGLSTNPNVKLALNMTWAYSTKSINENFIYYNYNQNTMFNAITNAYKQALNETGITLIIPSGTAIQNARTNKYLKAVGNDLTSDGYHLNTGIGRYIAGLAMFETIIHEEGIKRDIFEDVNFIPDTNDSTLDLAVLAKKAAKNAVAKPFEITPYNIKAYEQ